MSSTLSAAVTASASALAAERTRIEVAVSNMANAESTRGPDGQPYCRRDVVLAADRSASFDAALGRAGAVGRAVERDRMVVGDDEDLADRFVDL